MYGFGCLALNWMNIPRETANKEEHREKNGKVAILIWERMA